MIIVMVSLSNVLKDLHVFFSYRRTFFFIVRKKGIHPAYNFLYVKLFVKEGEGSLGILSKFFERILRKVNLSHKIAIYPRNVEMEITTRCNKECIFCEHTYWSEPNQDLTFEQFRRIVEQFPDLKWVNLTGEGDAFLNRDYLKMIHYMKDRNIPVFLVDSFDLINEKISTELVMLGVEGIYISFDGATKETYETIKKGCKFERTLDNIRKLLAIKKALGSPIPELSFRYIVTTLNYREMPGFIDLVSSLGSVADLGDSPMIEFVGLLHYDNTKQFFIDHIPPEIIQEAKDKAERYGIRLMFSHFGKALPPLERCSAWVEPYIMMGGYVMPCCQVLQSNQRESLRDKSFGNIFETPFSEIWYSEQFVQFREMIPRSEEKVPEICAGCRAYSTSKRIGESGIWKKQ